MRTCPEKGYELQAIGPATLLYGQMYSFLLTTFLSTAPGLRFILDGPKPQNMV